MDYYLGEVMRRNTSMTTEENDAATAYLKQLIEEHPEATDDEIWELFRPAVMNNEQLKRAIEAFYIRQLN
jgi:alkylhydroperoxidase family enzyme